MENKKKFLIILMAFLSFITLTMLLIFLFIKKDIKKHNEVKENININESNNSKIKENIESNKKDKKIVEQDTENKDDSSKKEEINNKKDEDKTSKQEEKTNNKPKTNTEEKKPNKPVEEVKPNTGTPPPKPKSVEKTLKQLNDEKIANMISRYGVKFMVRDQSRTRVGWTTGTAIYDEEKLKKVLNEIDYILSRYPTGFFKEFNSNGMSLSLNILDRINGGLYGLSDSEFLSNVVISISTSNYLYEETLHHEILHYIDNYIETKMYPASPETEYVTCNPAGFTYGNPNSSLSFNYRNSREAYFVADYGQKNYKEDRATLFPRLMRPSITGGNDFLSYPDSPLTCKARVLIRQIDRAFNTVTSSKSIAWNKLVK